MRLHLLALTGPLFQRSRIKVKAWHAIACPDHNLEGS